MNTASAEEKLAEFINAGAYILSDNDGTLAPFTKTPDETVIPQETLRSIARFQACTSDDKFQIVSGRDKDAMQQLVNRSSPTAPDMPLVTDDGARFTWKDKELVILSDDEVAFFDAAKTKVNAFIDAAIGKDPTIKDQIAIETRVAGMNINLNLMHDARGENATAQFDAQLKDLFEGICKDANFAVHRPPGHGIEMRSTLTTKKQGILALIDRGIIPEDAPLVFLCDDIKVDGNDVALAQHVTDKGGMVVQIKHTGNFRDYPNESLALTPDVVLEGSEAIAGLINGACDKLNAPKLGM